MNSANIVLPDNYESTWLIGFRLDPDREEPKLFTLIFSGDRDFPLAIDGYIIFFNNLDLIPNALELVNYEQRKVVKTPNEIDLVVDIAVMLYLICEEDIDDSATIVNGLNIIFDLVKATNLPFPSKYKQNLYKLADHTTFSKDLLSFFQEEDIKRADIHDALLWCIGVIVSKSQLLEDYVKEEKEKVKSKEADLSDEKIDM